jgi:glycosyltransferase involved in cell wall biosynthesis
VRISVITPCLDARPFIAQAIESVPGDAGEIEHIIVDGGSTDGTLETLARYPGLRVLVRPGLGLYPALNLGVEEARGDLIGFLNADDRYLPGALAAAASSFAAGAADCVAGGARVVRLAPSGRRETVVEYRDLRHKLPDWEPLLFGAPIINARLYRRAFVAQIGAFDTRYAIAADREWLIRAKLGGMRVAAMDALLYEYQEHPGSLTINRTRANFARIRDEHLAIIARYIGDPRARAVMRRWHAWETGRKTVHHLAQGDIAGARDAARQGTAESALWLPRFLAEAPRRIVSRMAMMRRNSASRPDVMVP